MDRILLRIFVKVIRYSIDLCHVLSSQCIRQFKNIELFTHPDVRLHERQCDARGSTVGRHDEFVQLSGQTTQVGSHVFGQQFSRRLFDGNFFPSRIVSDPFRELPFSEFGTLKEHAHLFQQFGCGLAPVERAVHVAKNQHSRRLRLRGIERFEISVERGGVFEVLRLVNQHH